MPILVILAGILLFVGFTVFVLGLLTAATLKFAVAPLSLAGLIILTVGLGLAIAAGISYFASRARKYCLYEIVAGACRQDRWQVGRRLCAECPQDGICVDNVTIEVWDVPAGEPPTESSPRCQITLRRVQRECSNCPTGVPIIGIVQPAR